MRAVVQRVRRARVSVEDGGVAEVVGQIGIGLCVLLGVTHGDREADAVRMADKLAKLRIFPDAENRMNLSVRDIGGEILVVSQFTLYADAARGNRPSFVAAARPDVAEPLVETTVAALRAAGVGVETGRFRSEMDVELVNWGPVTITVDLSGSGG